MGLCMYCSFKDIFGGVHNQLSFTRTAWKGTVQRLNLGMLYERVVCPFFDLKDKRHASCLDSSRFLSEMQPALTQSQKGVCKAREQLPQTPLVPRAEQVHAIVLLTNTSSCSCANLTWPVLKLSME